MNLIEYFMGGRLFCPFCPRGQGGGYVEYPRLSTRGGAGVKIWSKLVHVVVECPLSIINYLEIKQPLPICKKVQLMKNLVHAFKIETKTLLFGCAIIDKSVYVPLNQMPKAIFKSIPVPYHYSCMTQTKTV